MREIVGLIARSILEGGSWVLTRGPGSFRLIVPFRLQLLYRVIYDDYHLGLLD